MPRPFPPHMNHMPRHPHQGYPPGYPPRHPGHPGTPDKMMAAPHTPNNHFKNERAMDGPMSPASSIGDTDSPRPQRPPSAASSQGSESVPSAPVKPVKTSAKIIQKLMVLYEPESPDRRRFIDELIKFHEDRGNPLKGPPMFAQAPLDVFTLYHHVKGKGGMNEVTKKKEWGEIVRLMNFPVSPSAGFTLKKQYVKFLFEVCTFQR